MIRLKIRKPSKQAGLSMLGGGAAQAQTVAESLARKASPVYARAYALRRRAATIAVLALAIILCAHVMFGTNGMMVYKQKRDEYHSLQKKIAQEATDNDLYSRQIQGLKSDAKAIEKEAREQLHYAKPGEYIYVPTTPAIPTPPMNHSAKK